MDTSTGQGKNGLGGGETSRWQLHEHRDVDGREDGRTILLGDGDEMGGDCGHGFCEERSGRDSGLLIASIVCVAASITAVVFIVILNT